MQNCDLLSKEELRSFSERVVAMCIKDKHGVAERCIEPEFHKAFMAAETFVIDADAFLFDRDTAGDIEATWADMKTLQIARPPFQNFIIHGIMSGAQLSVFYRFSSELDHYDHIIFSYGVNAAGMSKLRDNRVLELAPAALLMYLVVLLGTRGVQLRRLAAHTLFARAQKGKGAVTYVNPPLIAPDGRPVAEEGAPAGSVRPHLRRGHIRRQSYGLGHKLSKLIWVQPCFVGGTPEVQREAYVTARSS